MKLGRKIKSTEITWGQKSYTYRYSDTSNFAYIENKSATKL